MQSMDKFNSGEIFEGVQYNRSKDVDWTVTDKTLQDALSIVPPEFDSLLLPPACNEAEGVRGDAVKKKREDAWSRSDSVENYDAKTMRFGSFERIIEYSVKANSFTDNSERTQINPDMNYDEDRKAVCKKFFKFMNVGDMNGLARLISEQVSEACQLVSPDLREPIVGRAEIMTLFSLLFETYPDGVWALTNSSVDQCRKNTIVCLYRFTGTGVIDHPLNTIFMLIREHREAFIAHSDAEQVMGGDLCNVVAEYCHPPRPPNMMVAKIDPKPQHLGQPLAVASNHLTTGNVSSSSSSTSTSQRKMAAANTGVGQHNFSKPTKVNGTAQSISDSENKNSTSNQPKPSTTPCFSSTTVSRVGSGIESKLRFSLANQFFNSNSGSNNNNVNTASKSSSVANSGINCNNASATASKTNGGSNHTLMWQVQKPGQELVPSPKSSPSMSSSGSLSRSFFGSSGGSGSFAASQLAGLNSSSSNAAAIAASQSGEEEDDGIIRIPKRAESLHEMGILENNVLKNGPISHRRKLEFTFDNYNMMEQISMSAQ